METKELKLKTGDTVVFGDISVRARINADEVEELFISSSNGRIIIRLNAGNSINIFSTKI